MNAGVSDFVAPWLPTTKCVTDNSLVGVRLIESRQGCVIVIVNFTGKPKVPVVHVTVRVTGITKAESLEQGVLKFKTTGDVVEFELPVGLTDSVLLRR